MKFLKRLFWVGIMLLTGLIAVLIVRACTPHLPRWLLRFFTGSEFGRFLFELFLNVAMLGIVYALQRCIQGLYLQSKGQNGPAPNPRPRPEPPARRTTPASVAAKRTKTKQRPRSRPEFYYHIGFRLEDEQELWFSVGEQEFRRLSEGDRGQLTFRGKSYVSFLKDGEGVGSGGT